jgi:hypothetical protein
MLTEKFREYLDQKAVIKTVGEDLKDARMCHDLWASYETTKKEAGNIKAKIDNSVEVSLIKEKYEAARERGRLLLEILMAEMQENGDTEVEYQGKKAVIVPKLKVGSDQTSMFN